MWVGSLFNCSGARQGRVICGLMPDLALDRKTGHLGLEPRIAGFGDRCLSQFGQCPRGWIVDEQCGRRDLNPHDLSITRT
jgi:hypothetical protein